MLPNDLAKKELETVKEIHDKLLELVEKKVYADVEVMVQKGQITIWSVKNKFKP